MTQNPTAPTESLTRETLENKALKDYESVSGKIIYPVWVTFSSEDEESNDFYVGGETPLRVIPNQSERTILHWNNEWLDPYWDLELIGTIPELEHLKNPLFWTHGKSYHLPKKIGRTPKEDTSIIYLQPPTPWWKKPFKWTAREQICQTI